MTPLVLAAAGLLLLFSAALSAAETAAFTLTASRLRTMQEEGFRGARRLVRVRFHEPGLRGSLLAVNLLVTVLAGGLVSADLLARWGTAGLVVGLPLTAVGLVLLAELFPRSLAYRRPVRLALLGAPFLLRLHRAVRTVLSPLVRMEHLLDRANGEEPETPAEREVRELAEIGRREGLVEEEEHLLVERAFRLDELMAWNIMTPRVEIYALSDSLTIEEVVKGLSDVPYSRLPIYGQSIDDITGILHVRAAYEAYVSGKPHVRLSEIAHAPMFVPGSLPLTRLLKDFQSRRTHMGIIADEFGGTDGLVTLEDVLEELVGEIEDETDIEDEPLIRISRTEIETDGGVELREVNAAFNVSLPHLEHRSLNGYLLEELGRVPEPGEKLERPGLIIEVLDATETQVLRARIRKTQPTNVEDTS